MSSLVARLEEGTRLAAQLARHYCTKTQGQVGTVVRDAKLPTKAALYTGLIVVTCIWLAIAFTRRVRLQRARRSNSTRPSTPNLEKRSPLRAQERQFGVWHPVPFSRPRASPYPDWSLSDTKPLPYRPFRYGPKYNITMGLRSMDWDEWIELDNEYLRYHSLKASRMASRGDQCIKTAPEAWDAAVELVEELAGYLPERYPSLFSTTDEGCLRNLATDEVFDVQRLERNGAREDPMALCARLVQDDLAIMMEGKDGQYYLLAGAILLAGFWRLQDKFGMGLSEIHTSGDVPGFKEKLERGMVNFFRRIQPSSPMLRNNYFIQVDDGLAWSESIGSEDATAEGEVGWFTAEKNKAIEHHYFRSERQSLRRLPRSGGVVFTIRTYMHPITSLAQERHVPGRLASAIRSWGDDVSRYKGKERYGEVLLAYLDSMDAEQKARGLMEEGSEGTARGYPF